MKGGRQTIAVTITIIKCNKNSLGCQTTSYWPSRKKPYFQEVETCAKWNVVASVLLLFTFVPYWVHSISLLLFSLVPRMVDNAKQCTNFFHIHIFSQMNLWDIYIYIYIYVCVYIYIIFFMEFNLLHYSSLTINHKFPSGTTISLYSTMCATCTGYVLYTNAWRW